jgi:hypothetical protein
MRLVVRTAAAGELAENRDDLRSIASNGAARRASAVSAPDELRPVDERAAEARVHAVVQRRGALDVPVEGVRELAVGREPHRVGAAQDDVEPRLLAAVVAPRHRLGREAEGGHRREIRAVHTQQAGGVAGNHPAHGVEQAVVAVGGGKRGGEVAGHAQQHRQRITL